MNVIPYSKHPTVVIFLLAEAALTSAYDYQAWLIKTDKSGNLTWSKTYGDTYIDEAYKVRQTADGGFIIAGMSTSFG